MYLTESAKADERLRVLVSHQIIETGIGTQKAVAEKMRISEVTLIRKLKTPDKFTRGELRRLFRILRFTDEQIREVAV